MINKGHTVNTLEPARSTMQLRKSDLDLTELMEILILVLVSTEVIELAYHISKMNLHERKIDQYLIKMNEHVDKINLHMFKMDQHLKALESRITTRPEIPEKT
jgi:hypothetical protein